VVGIQVLAGVTTEVTPCTASVVGQTQVDSIGRCVNWRESTSSRSARGGRACDHGFFRESEAGRVGGQSIVEGRRRPDAPAATVGALCCGEAAEVQGYSGEP